MPRNPPPTYPKPDPSPAPPPPKWQAAEVVKVAEPEKSSRPFWWGVLVGLGLGG